MTERWNVKTSDGGAIAVWIEGDGPPLVLVHGSISDHVFAMDRRGFGGSPDAPGYSAEREFSDVAAVVNAVMALRARGRRRRHTCRHPRLRLPGPVLRLGDPPDDVPGTQEHQGRSRPATQLPRGIAGKIGFEYSQEAQSLVQLRQPLVPPRGEARSDLQIVFDLATRLGLGAHFWDGEIEAAFRHQLAPSGITLEELRTNPAGVRVPLTTRYRKYTETGFATPSGKVELYSATLAAHGYAPLPAFEEPLTSPRSRTDLADRYPLVLSCAKSLFFCETQHRQVASLRKSARDPQVEMHPSTASARGIAAGDWISLETPHGSIRARAKFNPRLDPQVVFGQHGWWEACDELGLPGYPPYGPDSANLNLVLRQTPSDPISGSSPLRASVCDVFLLSAVVSER